MISEVVKKTYILDTNILIGLSLWIPISLNRVFWTALEKALRNGNWVLMDVVVNEIKYNEELVAWCKDQGKNGLVKKLSDDDRERAVEINDKYKMIDDVTKRSTVDTFLIAHAERNKLFIFSRESQRKNTTELYKIPDVCLELKVGCIKKPELFLKEIGFRN